MMDKDSGRVPAEPGCEPAASAADGVFAESHPSREYVRAFRERHPDPWEAYPALYRAALNALWEFRQK